MLKPGNKSGRFLKKAAQKLLLYWSREFLTPSVQVQGRLLASRRAFRFFFRKRSAASLARPRASNVLQRSQ
jgi:hypothetical protein